MDVPEGPAVHFGFEVEVLLSQGCLDSRVQTLLRWGQRVLTAEGTSVRGL